MEKQELEEKLIVGARIKYGKKYAEHSGCTAGSIITLIEGYFENDNGLYTTTDKCPAVWDDKLKDFDSIYHLFGNDFEYFYDCKII